ncbi:MAG: hypothetical protein NXH75_11945 [Halobacteriovoraceae bacterium]|nr:hypothetical protein [Halobacteriovoraceae bacterium]
METKNSLETVTRLSALLMGVIVFLFQSLIYRWLNVAVGATVINQIAILVSTYLFFGLGALSSLRIPKGKLFGHFSLLILLSILALNWPNLPLWLSAHLRSHEFRFVLTLLLTSPFFFLFGMALPQYNQEAKGINFSEIFLWFHLGAGLFLFLWNTFFIAKLGMGFSLYLILFLTTALFAVGVLTEKGSVPSVENHPFSWNWEIFNLSILNGVIQAFLIYLNNRIMGPFTSSFTFYLVTSIISLALAGAFTNRFKVKKEDYKRYVLKYLPLVLSWCLGISFILP